MIFQSLKAAQLRLFFILKKKRNAITILSSISTVNLLLIFLPKNIFEYPNISTEKIINVFDLAIMFIPTYYIYQIFNEKWQHITFKKWKESTYLIILEQVFTSIMFSLFFILVLLSSVVIISNFLGYDFSFLLQYSISRFSFIF